MGLPPLSAGMTLAVEFERGTVAGRLPQWQGAQGWDGNQEAVDPRVGLWQSLGCTWDLHYLSSGVGLGGVLGLSCLGNQESWEVCRQAILPREVGLSTCPWCPACALGGEGGWRRGWGPGGGWIRPQFVVCDALIILGPSGRGRGRGRGRACGQESLAGTRGRTRSPGSPTQALSWEPGAG